MATAEQRTPGQPGHTCYASSDVCAGCEYVMERDRRIMAVRAQLDAALFRVATLEAETARLRTLAEGAAGLAKVATNTWACVARSKRDFDVIGGLHRDIDALRAALGVTPDAPGGTR